MENFSTNVAILFKLYINFCFFSLIAPFRIVSTNNCPPNGSSFVVRHSRETGKHSSKKYEAIVIMLQKVLCGLSLLLSLPWLFRNVRLSIPKDHKIPSQHFSLFFAIASFMAKLCLIKKLWFNRDNILTLLHSIPVPTISNSKRKILTSKPFLTAVTFLYAVTILSAVITGIGFTHFTWRTEWSGEEYVKQIVVNFRHALSIGPSVNVNSTRNWELSEVDYMTAIFATIGLLQRHILGYFTDLFLICSIATLWFSTTSFLEYFMDTETIRTYAQVSTSFATHFHMVLEEYKKLVHFTSLVNSLIGSNLTWFLLETIFYYSTSFNEVLIFAGSTHGLDFIQVVRLLMFLVGMCLILLMSADIAYKVSGYWRKQTHTLAKLICNFISVIMFPVLLLMIFLSIFR